MVTNTPSRLMPIMQALKAAGIATAGFATQAELDPEIHLCDGRTIQVCHDGSYGLCVEGEGNFELDYFETIPELIEKIKEIEDPTPYCSGCGAMSKSKCKCGPLADND